MKIIRSLSEYPLILSAVILIAIMIAVSFSSVQNILSENIGNLIKLIQGYAIVVYVLITSKFYVDSGLIAQYNPGESMVGTVANWGGPFFALVAELGKIVTSLQLSMLLFTGITFNQWEHSLSASGWNYILLTITAIVFAVIALLDLSSRTYDMKYYWSDLGEVLPSDVSHIDSSTSDDDD